MKLRNIQSFIMEPIVKPFLKWAGAKTPLIRTLRELFPDGEFRFIEPFVGSGVVFLNTRYRSSLLSDTNRDIISLYSVLKDQREKFIAVCKDLFAPENKAEERYYELRTEFNACAYGQRRAALFLYLNRHCFNGLCRYNQQGKFNTPFGKYSSVYFPAEEMLVFADKLATAQLEKADFRKPLGEAGEGDVVYCDPPYVPLSKSANFTNYAAGGFSQKDQKELYQLAIDASDRGAVVLLSNHDTDFTRDLYQRATRVVERKVSRTISCDGQNRTKAKELIAVFGKIRHSQLLL
jgi:DNA adenine methylase